MTTPAAELIARIEDRRAVIGVIGLGYVGLPISLAAIDAGFEVLGFDVDPAKPRQILAGKSYLKHIPAEALREAMATGRLDATDDFTRLADADALLICVPTPLTQHLEPDLSYVTDTAEAIARHLRPGQLVVLESTTFPGTTDEILTPILEKSGLVSGTDFFIAYSPEREDPGNLQFSAATIPKVVGADDDDAHEAAQLLYGALTTGIVPVSSTRTAEAVKLTENIFRAVNIALVNELKVIYDAMDVNVWEVIDAAKTKPFGFMPFYPGPGLGGHCIPIDPFYLTWKAREYDISTRFIELAGQINSRMPMHVIERLAVEMDMRLKKGLNGSRILVMGVAYKKNVDDMRESPALRIIELLEERGASVAFHDPHVPEIPPTRKHPTLTGRRSAPWTDDLAAAHDAALIVTDHDDVDYASLVEHAALVVDTRNICAKRNVASPKIALA